MGNFKMKKILDDFYNGNFIPADNNCLNNPEMLKLMDDAADSEEKLLSMINSDTKDIFEAYTETINQIQESTIKKKYLEGFRTGMRLALEALSNNK
jgi:hypothetical protein